MQDARATLLYLFCSIWYSVFCIHLYCVTRVYFVLYSVRYGMSVLYRYSEGSCMLYSVTGSFPRRLRFILPPSLFWKTNAINGISLSHLSPLLIFSDTQHTEPLPTSTDKEVLAEAASPAHRVRGPR